MTDETLDRIADALEKLVDACKQAQFRDHYALTDRYAANEARQREEAESDPLDEGDHRDRVARLDDGGERVKRLTRREGGHWHTYMCTDSCRAVDAFSLAWWARDAVLTFAPDASPAPQDAAQDAAEGECDAVEGGGPAGPPEALLCHECGHGIDEHIDAGRLAGHGTGVCPCPLTPSPIARHLIAQATS